MLDGNRTIYQEIHSITHGRPSSATLDGSVHHGFRCLQSVADPVSNATNDSTCMACQDLLDVIFRGPPRE